MSQRKKRLNIINLLYRHYLMKYSAEKTFKYALELKELQKLYLLNNNLIIDNNFLKNINLLLIKSENIIKTIQKNLKIDWEFFRLSNFHKAVLTYAIFENKYLNISKKIVINEAIEIIKIYGDNSDYKYINKVLDKITI